MKYTLAALAATAMSANAALVTIDNFDPAAPGTYTNGNGSYNYQSFTANVAGAGAGDTVAANLPLTSTVDLVSATFRRADSGTADGGLLFVNVFSGTGHGTAATYLGSSTNSIDVNSAGFGSLLTWNFTGITLDSGTEYTLSFSSSADELNDNRARISAANNGAGFNANYYTGGQTSVSTQDLRFSVTVDTIAVPEPSSTALLGLGGLALIMRRRK